MPGHEGGALSRSSLLSFHEYKFPRFIAVQIPAQTQKQESGTHTCPGRRRVTFPATSSDVLRPSL